MSKKKKKNTYYVDNKKFYVEMCKFHEARLKDPDYKIPNYIGECILLICTKLSFSPNFINYSYREDMIADAIENCIRYINNFKPVLTKADQNDPNRVKKSNPFSYFTMYAYNAFIRRIEKEKGVQRIKAKYVQNMAVLDDIYGDNVLVSTQDHDNNSKITNDLSTTLQFYYNYDLSPKQKKAKKKKGNNDLDIEKNFGE